MAWFAPRASAAGPEVKLSDSEKRSMKGWMHQALQEAEAAASQGLVKNSALIVDPISGRCVH